MTGYGTAKALMANLVDYAGIFPPAALPLHEALKVAAAFRSRSRHPWILSRLALPLTDIKELTPRVLYDAGSDGSPWLFAALGAVATSEDWLRSLEWDFREIKALNAKGAGASVRIRILSYETKVPDEDPEAIGPLVHRAVERLEALTFGGI